MAFSAETEHEFTVEDDAFIVSDSGGTVKVVDVADIRGNILNGDHGFVHGASIKFYLSKIQIMSDLPC